MCQAVNLRSSIYIVRLLTRDMLNQSRTSPGPPPPGEYGGIHTCNTHYTLVYRWSDVYVHTAYDDILWAV